MIHELQKKVLEEQEKLAVAIKVDNEKNSVISNFQAAWIKLKKRLQNLESENNNLQISCQTTEQRNQLKISEFKVKVERYEGELSKALDLAAGYKEKSDELVREKLDLLKSHVDELEKYKTLVQEAEDRRDKIKEDYAHLSGKTQRLEESLKNAHEELNKERVKEGQVRNEMTVIHKALDTCEAEITVLRQEKEDLQLKLREELNRNNILEQSKASLSAAVEEAKKSEV